MNMEERDMHLDADEMEMGAMEQKQSKITPSAPSAPSQTGPTIGRYEMEMGAMEQKQSKITPSAPSAPYAPSQTGPTIGSMIGANKTFCKNVGKPKKDIEDMMAYINDMIVLENIHGTFEEQVDEACDKLGIVLRGNLLARASALCTFLQRKADGKPISSKIEFVQIDPVQSNRLSEFEGCWCGLRGIVHIPICCCTCRTLKTIDTDSADSILDEKGCCCLLFLPFPWSLDHKISKLAPGKDNIYRPNSGNTCCSRCITDNIGCCCDPGYFDEDFCCSWCSCGSCTEWCKSGGWSCSFKIMNYSGCFRYQTCSR
jgi:hypothetical protein